MKARSIHELLIIVRKKVESSRSKDDSSQMLKPGLCWIITNLRYYSVISDVEGEVIINYLYDHQPKGAMAYFWTPYKIKPRLQWLTKHINLTKPS